MRRGLTPRIVVAGGLLALLVASTFAFLLAAVRDEAESSRRARHIRTEMATADASQRQLIELDRDVRGFVLTGDPRFLDSWEEREDYLRGLEDLESFVADDRMAQLVDRIGSESRRYLDEVLAPIVEATERGGEPSGGFGQLLGPAATEPESLLGEFDAYQESEAALLAAEVQGSNDATDRAALAALVGVGGSIVLVAVFVGYLMRKVLRPLRRASTMADLLAGGNLSVRLGEDGPGEIGQLERSFNTMGSALDRGRSRLVGLVDEVAASRARIVAASDDARRRIERDIHDGAQQRLIALGLELRLAEMSVPEEDTATRAEFRRLGDSLGEAVESLQEVARGIHPAILSHGGLTPALDGLARRSPVPATVSSEGGRRLSESVEVAAYYLVSEALTNVAKHASASSVAVGLDFGDDELRIVIRDDGVGGAHLDGGSGLIGLRDRVEAVGGRFSVDSPLGGGTTIEVTMPTAPPVDDPRRGR